MKPPNGLGNAGKALWKALLASAPEDWELDERETVQLTLAARQMDDLARLEVAIKKDGTMVKGSAGQPVVNPAIGEARQARAAIDRLIGRISVPDETGKPRTTASELAQRAANARWGPRHAA